MPNWNLWLKQKKWKSMPIKTIFGLWVNQLQFIMEIFVLYNVMFSTVYICI
jgi:hypothetical protein